MDRARKVFVVGVLSTIIVHLFILSVLPPERTLGETYKILYVHVPPIWVAYIGFVISLVSSILYIVKNNYKYDVLAYSAVFLGVILSGLGIVLGSIFSGKAWGTHWEWREPRMTSTLILFLAYLGYLVLRSSIGDLEKRMSVSAVYAIMVFVTVPMSYVSVKMFRSLHPLPELSPLMKYMLVVSLLVQLLLFLPLFYVFYRSRLERARKVFEVNVG